MLTLCKLFLGEEKMIRRITKNEACKVTRKEENAPCKGRKCMPHKRGEAEEKNACDALEVEALVDLAVKALKDFGVEEIEYAEGEEPDENEAICADEDGNEVGIEIKGNKLKIDLDEDEDIIVKLDQPVEDVKAELKDDLDAKLAEQEEAEESNKRFKAWKRDRKLRKEGKRIALNRR